MIKATSKERRVADLIERKLLLSDPYYQLILTMMKSVTPSNFHGKRILEVGCGLGGFCIRMAKMGANPVGLDISSSAINKAKDLAKQCEVQNRVDFIIGDAQFLPFKEKSNEIVVCSETLEHVENYEQAFDELVRVTENSGYLCLTVPNLFSSLFFEYMVLLSVGQPKYAKKLGNVEKEHIFHLFKVKKLLSREDLRLIDVRSTDFLHLPPTIRKVLRIDHYLNVLSEKLEKNGGPLRLFGASIGVLGRKE